MEKEEGKNEETERKRKDEDKRRRGQCIYFRVDVNGQTIKYAI